ncbi:sigma-70 family RNA polymerase sigma factor [Arachidicoccus terrestris]|uniref:sigma-70 family RNA polymerase sigma factor n=1 Tax=Arachidicoccus terrestris TaxID=2875539 RepID=UPI001CC33A45|nr:sigma-70 family RNA polymerase sigma factor [Arachidicoccus terrestris]UAY56642.1 sigma-70 family RNA polymerase sigma factor [Arachidicoccus terrestris]
MQMNASTSELNKPAPEHWVDKYADYLYAYASTRINDRDLARDLVQETFLAALQRIDKFEGRSSEKTWLTAILKNKIIDVYRKKAGRQKDHIYSSDSSAAEDDFFEMDTGHWKEGKYPATFGIEQPDIIEQKEFQRILLDCIQKLPPLWASVFNMKYIDEEASEKICAALQLTTSNFWVISHRTKVNLRACLQKNWF